MGVSAEGRELKANLTTFPGWVIPVVSGGFQLCPPPLHLIDVEEKGV